MPVTIPYDPSLPLGSVITPDTIASLASTARNHFKSDAISSDFQALLNTQKSLKATRDELQNLGIPTGQLDAEIRKASENVAAASKAYATQKATAADAPATDLPKQQEHPKFESPVDFTKSKLKFVSAISQSVDTQVQYFEMDANPGDRDATAQSIAAFVSRSTILLGRETQARFSSTAHDQVRRVHETSDIVSTLVICASSTRLNESTLSPFVLNVEKGIKVWNKLFPDEEDKLVPTSQGEMTRLALKASAQATSKSYNVVSGATFASGFVGLLHVPRSEGATTLSSTLAGLATRMQGQIDTGEWSLSQDQGSSGIGQDLKSVFATTNVKPIVSLITMQAASSDNGTESNRPSDSASAIAPVTLSETNTDKQGNSLSIDAFNAVLIEYFKGGSEAAPPIGMPSGLYVTEVTKSMLAEAWLAKYHPGTWWNEKQEPTES